MKRTIVLAALALSLFAVGCSKSQSGGGGEARSAVDYTVTEPIEIVWWHALENQYSDLIAQITDDFNKSQDLITVKAEYIGSYTAINQALVAAHAAGTGLPALAVANTPYVAQYGANGVCENLTPYINATGFDIDDFGEGMIRASAYENQQVSLPFLISTQVVYYNKTMADAKGITVPSRFADMSSFLAQVTEKNPDGSTKVWGTVVPGWDQWYFETFYINNGVNIINDDGVTTDLADKNALDTTKEIGNWIKNGYAYFAAGTDASSRLRQNFIEGNAFSVIHTSSLYNTYVDRCDFEVGMAWLPATDTRKQEIGGCVLLIPSKNTQAVKNAAWQFLAYLCSKEMNMKWADGTGYMPTRKSVLETSEGQDFLRRKPAFQCIFDNLDNINPRIQHKNWNQLAEIWKAYLARFYNEGIDIDSNIQTMAEEIDEVLED